MNNLSNILALSTKKNANKASVKFPHEVKLFLANKNCKITKENTKGIRYEAKSFEMIFLKETQEYYTVTQF